MRKYITKNHHYSDAIPLACCFSKQGLQTRLALSLVALLGLFIACANDNTKDDGPALRGALHFSTSALKAGNIVITLERLPQDMPATPQYTFYRSDSAICTLEAATKQDVDTCPNAKIWSEDGHNRLTVTIDGATTLTATEEALVESNGNVTPRYYVLHEASKGTIAKAELKGSKSFPERRGHSSVMHNGKIWVIGGAGTSGNFLNDVWSSKDGVDWIQVDANDGNKFSARTVHSMAVHHGKMWVTGGISLHDNGSGVQHLSDVWSSEDGVDWTEVNADSDNKFPARREHSTVMHNGKIWVIGGAENGNSLNDVWSSEDGVDWMHVNANSGNKFSARTAHSTVSYNNNLWITSGFSGQYLSDVWSSEDGVDWTEVNADSDNKFTVRIYHSTVVHNGKMWVTGGVDNGNYLNDVWSSEDGVDWTEVNADSDNKFPARREHSSVVHNGKIWVIGGQKDESTFFNDVWSSKDGADWENAFESYYRQPLNLNSK